MTKQGTDITVENDKHETQKQTQLERSAWKLQECLNMLDTIFHVDQETLHERSLLIHDSSPSIYNSRLKGDNTTISAN